MARSGAIDPSSAAVPWPLRRLGREVDLVLATLSDRARHERWWDRGNNGGGQALPTANVLGTDSTAPDPTTVVEKMDGHLETVLEDSLRTHLASVGAQAAHMAVFRAAVRRSSVFVSSASTRLSPPKPLTLTAYARLIERLGFGNELVVAITALEKTCPVARQAVGCVADGLASALLARLGSAVTACIEGRSAHQILPIPHNISTLATALLGLFGSPISAIEAALALRGVTWGSAATDNAHPVEVGMLLLRACITLTIKAVESGMTPESIKKEKILEGAGEVVAVSDCACSLEPATQELIRNYAMCAALLAGAAVQGPRDPDLSTLCSELRSILDRAKVCTWDTVLKLLMDETEAIRGDDAEHFESSTIERWSLHDQDFAVLWPREHCLDGQVLRFWQELGEAVASVPTQQGSIAPPSVVTERPVLKVDLYADPVAKATQKALQAALPAGKRVEALLTAATRADETHGTFESIVVAWQEAPEACAAVVFRCSGSGASAWPTPILAPALATLLRSGVRMWRQTFASGLPSDKGLFDALWTELCEAGDSSLATEAVPLVAAFWSWALGALCVSRLARVSADQSRDTPFAAHVALRVATTLKADLALLRAKQASEAAVANRTQIAGNRTSDSAVCSSRLQGLSHAPLASTLLSLVEVIVAGAAGAEQVDASLDAWFQLLCDMKAGGFQLPRKALTEMARLRSAVASLDRYAGLYVSVLAGEGDGQHQMVTSGISELFRACAHPETSFERAREVAMFRSRIGNFDPLQIISSACEDWPARKLAELVIRIMPVLLEDLCLASAPRTNQNDKIPRLSDGCSYTSILKAMGLLYCAAVAHLRANRVSRWVLLHKVVNVIRQVATELPQTTVNEDAAGLATDLGTLLGGLLHTLLGGVLPEPGNADLEGISGIDDEEIATNLVPASLLLRLLRLTADGGPPHVGGPCEERWRRCTSPNAREWLQRVEAVGMATA
eukprot:TRINITY_DN21520_c0_g1_i1.p1 TRINITY_DN21520_c0_g1~~TRINITY_DN21520_c0_g1_i1.p1  ORF type:complete len:966 (+),score=115.44 TRINITY_DN21520_c0_g1_i1:41-2938(+)